MGLMGLRTGRGFWDLSLKIPYISPSDIQSYLTSVSHTLSQATDDLNEHWEALRATCTILTTSTIAPKLMSHA